MVLVKGAFAGEHNKRRAGQHAEAAVHVQVDAAPARQGEFRVGVTDRRVVFCRGKQAVALHDGVQVAVAVSAGLVAPRQVLAAWPKAAFEARSVQDALKGIYGSDLTEASGDISIKAPDIAENGAVVPVTINTGMNAESIAIVVEQNGTPLAATFNLASNTQGYVSTRIKMGKTSNVIAVVKSGGKVYSARKEVKVTIGGCGG